MPAAWAADGTVHGLTIKVTRGDKTPNGHSNGPAGFECFILIVRTVHKAVGTEWSEDLHRFVARVEPHLAKILLLHNSAHLEGPFMVQSDVHRYAKAGSLPDV